jgi:hypothetical protein
MVLLLQELIRIDIHRLVRNDYWSATVGGYRLELNPVSYGRNYFLVLDVNGVRTSQRWMLSTRPIRGRLQRGGKIPWDKNEVWYVHGNDGRRYCHLYLNPPSNQIGTRDAISGKYKCNVLSRKKRQAEKAFRDELKKIIYRGPRTIPAFGDLWLS